MAYETVTGYCWPQSATRGEQVALHLSSPGGRPVSVEVARVGAVRTVVFTDPELARVGLSESEAEASGVSYRLATLPMSAVLRTRTLSEPRGFMKMLIDKDSDRILGFAAFGAEASELMAIVQTAMLGELPFTVLRDALFTHPTAAEGLTVLLANVATIPAGPH